MKKVFLFLAEGFEETEAITTADVLMRGGLQVQTVSISDKREVNGAHGIPVVADSILSQLGEELVDGLVFPGGMPGAKNLADNQIVIEMMQRHYDKGCWVAAICAAPALVVDQLQAGRKLHMTCYPGFEKYMIHAQASTDGVVVDGKVITGKGPGFSIAFGLTVVEHMVSPEAAREVAAGMLV